MKLLVLTQNKSQIKTPIHERKRRSSLVKSEMKRKSAAKVNTFLKEVVNDVNQKVAVKPQVTLSSTIRKNNAFNTNLNGTVQQHASSIKPVVNIVAKSQVAAPVQSQVKPLPPPPPAASEVKKAIDKRHLNNNNLLNQTKVFDKSINRPVSVVVKHAKVLEQK